MLRLCFLFIEKVDQVLDDTENTGSMVNQLLYRTFTRQQKLDKAVLPIGEKVRILNNTFELVLQLMRGLPSSNWSARSISQHIQATFLHVLTAQLTSSAVHERELAENNYI